MFDKYEHCAFFLENFSVPIHRTVMMHQADQWELPISPEGYIGHEREPDGMSELRTARVQFKACGRVTSSLLVGAYYYDWFWREKQIPRAKCAT